MSEKPKRHNGAAIRAFRIKLGMTPDDLAKATNLSAPHLRNIENEHREPRLEHLYRIATALEAPAAALVRDPSLLTGENGESAETA